ASGGGALRVTVIDGTFLFIGRVMLLLRPHERRIGFVIPHGVTEKGIHEHVGLVHVAHHALAGGDGAGELVAQGVARFVPVNLRVNRIALAPVAVARINTTVARVAVIGIDDVTGRAAGTAIIAGLVVGAEKPHQRIVQSRLGNVDDRYGDAPAGARAAI